MTGAGDGDAARVATTMRAQQAIDRGGAEAQEDRAQRRGDLEHAMALERLDKGGQEGRAAFAAEGVVALPHGLQEREYAGAISAGAGPGVGEPVSGAVGGGGSSICDVAL